MGQPALAIVDPRRFWFEANAFVKIWQALLLMRKLLSACGLKA